MHVDIRSYIRRQHHDRARDSDGAASSPHGRLAGLLQHVQPAASAASSSAGTVRCGRLAEQGHIIDAGLEPGTAASHMFTTLCPTRSGDRLFASCRRGVDKSQADGNAVIAESTDGREWQVVFTGFPAVQTCLQGSGRQVEGEVRASVLVELLDGSLLAVFCWMDHAARVTHTDGRTDMPARISEL